MSYTKFIFKKILVPLFMVLFTTMLTLNAMYFMSAENTDDQEVSYSDSYNDIVKKGNISFLITLGEMYEKGHFVKKDLAKSQAFFKKAINHINGDILDTADNVPDVEEKEISEGDDSAAEIKLVKLEKYNQTYIKPKTSPKIITPVKIVKERIIEKEPTIIKTSVNNQYNDEHIIYEDLEIIDIDDNDTMSEEIDPVVINDDNINYENIDAVMIDENVDNEVVAINTVKTITIDTASDDILSKNSFSSNPCNTAAARYIAKCIKIMRANRRH
ncbi:MAG: SEL1-like repeat protein [Gammaproteobacteria bacterium]